MIDHTTSRPDPQKKNASWHLNHRWRRANYFVSAGKRPSKIRDDDVTWQAYRFLRALERCKNKENTRELPDDFPDIGDAHNCYYSLSPVRKAEVEARLLAGQRNAAIAERCGIPAEVVGVFHDLFFDVRPHLGDAAVIARLALRWAPESGAVDQLGGLMLFGYSLGGRAVDALLHYVVAPPGSDAGEGVSLSAASHKALWLRLLEQLAWTLNSRAWSERTDLLLSLVTLLRKEGRDLVAEGVEIPVPRPWR